MPVLRRILATACLILVLATGCGQPEPTATFLPSVAPTAQTSAPIPPPSATPTTVPTGEPAPSGLSEDEIATLSSLTQTDDYPLYTMHYQGAYNREQASLEDSSSVDWACSLFAALGDADNRLYGRNFDWDFSPALLLFTDPPDGYASVSMVDIAYLGFDGAKSLTVADLPLAEREALLYAPFLPFDGLNEHGLAIGMAAVPPGNVPPDPDKKTIDSVAVIREMLDHARNVDEALAILQSYNIDMGGGPPIHYLLADRSGRSLLVEFYQGETYVIPNEAPWHQATNFLRASVGDDPERQCWRYDKISEQLAETQGRLTAAEAMDLLSGVAQPITQWSVVYGLSSGDIQVAMGGEYDSSHTFHLDLAAAPASEVDRPVADLKGLSLDEFFDESYKQLLLRDPQYLTYLGLSEEFGLRNDQLNDLSDAYIRETQALESTILDLLRTYDRAQLTPEQQVSYDVYEWYLDNRVRGHEFMYHNYTLHQFLGSYQDELLRLFTEIHPIDNRENAEDYVTRLSQVDDQIAQLLEGLGIREELGVIPPSVIVEFTLRSLRDITGRWAINTPFYTIFEEKLGALEELSTEEKQALLDAAKQEIEGSILPAFQDLTEYVEQLQPQASDDIGVWKLPDGDAYYAYLLRQETSTDLTPAEIHEIGLAEVVRIQEEMQAIFAELGYPQDASLSQLMDRAVNEAGYYNASSQTGRDQVIEAYEAILAEVDQHLDPVVDLRPRTQVIVIGDLSFGGGGGYYVSGTADGSRPGAFHTGVGGGQVAKYRMPTIAYHEAVPGHHFQIALTQELDLPFFRTDVFFNGYVEGWALYAERLAWELGLYDDDPYGNLGRLHLELLRAVRLVTDTGIHAMKWTRAEAQAYMNEAMGDPAGHYASEVDRYIVLPGQATGYKIGMLKILDLRQKARDRLGEQFDIKEFHNVILGNGSVPLDILERIVDDYIEAELTR